MTARLEDILQPAGILRVVCNNRRLCILELESTVYPIALFHELAQNLLQTLKAGTYNHTLCRLLNVWHELYPILLYNTKSVPQTTPKRKFIILLPISHPLPFGFLHSTRNFCTPVPSHRQPFPAFFPGRHLCRLHFHHRLHHRQRILCQSE